MRVLSQVLKLAQDFLFYFLLDCRWPPGRPTRLFENGTPNVEVCSPPRRFFLTFGAARDRLPAFFFPMNAQPEPGSDAPDFDAAVVGGEYAEGARVRLADLKGETVVLYFYPKDDTPGCTKQACALRDGWEDIRAKAKVFGVSTDGVKSHEKFIKKHALPFPILSDEDQQVVNAYGVWVEKNMYGNTYFALLPSWPRGEPPLDISIRAECAWISGKSADARGACQKAPIGSRIEADRRCSNDRNLTLCS